MRDDLFIIPSLKSCLRNQLTSSSQAQQLATILGAKPVNGIDKNVDILVVGIISKPYDQLLTTQKLTYARTYGIPKIDELAFISWCQWRLDQLKATL